MFQSKSTIKSKKQKELDPIITPITFKRMPIEIRSSSQQDEAIPIQKMRKTNNVNNNPITNFNSFKLERLKKVATVQKKQQTLKGLNIIEVFQNFGHDEQNNKSIISYKLDGSEEVKHISQGHLLGRITKARESVQNIRFDGQDKKQKTSLMQQQKVEQPKQPQQNKPGRYYDMFRQQQQEKRVIKCFRCNQKGHIAKNCLEEQSKQSCIYCLGNHSYRQCNSRTCFKCSQQGHLAQDCTRNGIQCNKCGKKGHKERNCGTIIFLDFQNNKSHKQLVQRYEADLRKLKCLNKCKQSNGHFNCFNYTQKKVKPYYDEKASSSSNFILF